jgi:hypothetical protein
MNRAQTTRLRNNNITTKIKKMTPGDKIHKIEEVKQLIRDDKTDEIEDREDITKLVRVKVGVPPEGDSAQVMTIWQIADYSGYMYRSNEYVGPEYLIGGKPPVTVLVEDAADFIKVAESQNPELEHEDAFTIETWNTHDAKEKFRDKIMEELNP